MRGGESEGKSGHDDREESSILSKGLYQLGCSLGTAP